jgi:hypothetical protein
MQRHRSWLSTVFAFAAVILGGCDRPVFNMMKLQRVRTEALSLMRTHPVGPAAREREIPKAEWPPTIARLHPQAVTVRVGGVDISTRPFFDGGWGYYVPRGKRDLPMPPECYSEPSKGLFWHGPC